MIKINISEVKTHLSRYLTHLAKGDTIVLCKRNVPIAEITLYRRSPQVPGRSGLPKAPLKFRPRFSSRFQMM